MMNMTYVLLFVALNQPSILLGTYNTEQSCQQAIRRIFEARIARDAIVSPKVQEAVNTALKYQQEYQCIRM